MNWNEIVDKVTPSIVKIETPRGHGTGFLCFYNESRGLCGIATAHHVVSHAERWQEPIRITNTSSAALAFLKEPDRFIMSDEDKDSAIILMSPRNLKLPENPIPLLPLANRLPIGVEVAWLGFPAIAQNTICFFSGNVSAWQDFRSAYLIDGVAINGASGGPVIYSTPTDGVQIVGSISAYRANRATGEALPGLSVAQDVSHFQASFAQIKSLDEANKKKAAEAAAAAAAAASGSEAPPSTEPKPGE